MATGTALGSEIMSPVWGSGVRGLESCLRVWGPGSCQRVRGPGSCTSVQGLGSCLRVRGRFFSVCLQCANFYCFTDFTLFLLVFLKFNYKTCGKMIFFSKQNKNLLLFLFDSFLTFTFWKLPAAFTRRISAKISKWLFLLQFA